MSMKARKFASIAGVVLAGMLLVLYQAGFRATAQTVFIPSMFGGPGSCFVLGTTDAAIRQCITTIENSNNTGVVYLPNATVSILSTLPAGYTNASSVAEAISYVGVKPNLQYPTACGSTESCWTSGGGGTWLDGGGGSFPIISANTSSVTTPTTATFWLNAVADGQYRDFGCANAQSCIQIGGHNNIGMTYGRVDQVYAYNMSGWAFQFTNSHHPSLGNLQVNDNSATCTAQAANFGGINIHEDVPSAIQNMGNFDQTDEWAVAAPANCRYFQGIKWDTAVGVLNLVKSMARTQVLGGPKTLRTDAATMTNTSSCIGVPDATQYQQGTIVYFSAATNGLQAVSEDSGFRATIDYVVLTSGVCATNGITIATGLNNSAFVANNNNAVNVLSTGMADYTIYAATGQTISAIDLSHMDIEAGAQQPTIYFENFSVTKVDLGPFNGVIIGRSAQNGDYNTQNLVHTDFDSSNIRWAGKLRDMLNAGAYGGSYFDNTIGGSVFCVTQGNCPFTGSAGTAGDFQELTPAEGGGRVNYPNRSLNWNWQTIGSTSFTLRNNECNGGGVEFNGSGNAAWTMPVISTSLARSSNWGMHCIIRVHSAHTVTLTAGSGQNFGGISGNTTYVLNQNDVVMFIADPLLAAWDVEVLVNGTQFGIHNGGAALQRFVGGTLAQATAVATLASTSDTSCFGTGTGTQTIPANWAYVGAQFRINCRGIYSTPAANTATITAKIKWGSTVLASVTTAAMPSSASNDDFYIDETCTIQSIGSTGTAICDGSLTYVSAISGTPTYNSLTATSAVTINTTTSNLLDATVAWSSVAGGQTANDNEASLMATN